MARLGGVPGAVAHGADHACAGVCVPAAGAVRRGHQAAATARRACSWLFMAALVGVASHLVAFTRSAPITARSGSCQGLRPEGTSKMLWLCEGSTVARVYAHGRGAPKDLGTLDGARGGLIFPRRVKVSPGLAVSAKRKQRTGGC